MSAVQRAGAPLALALMLVAPAASPALASPAPAPFAAPVTCPDGHGGRWLAERSAGETSTELSLVHESASGERTATVAVRHAGAGLGLDARLEGDGRGGAWVAWTEIDYLNTTTEVRAAHADARGTLLARGDTALASFFDLFDAVALLPDGRGGAYIAWREADANHDRHVRLARLSAGGAPAAGWPARGLTLAQPQGNVRPHLVADGEGGAIVVADPDPNRAGGAAFALRVSPTSALLR
jgi:hypothetical protein